MSINIACDQVEFRRISLTGFRSCASRSQTGASQIVTSLILKSDLTSYLPELGFDDGSRKSAVAELVDLIEAHDHLNPIFIPKCDDFWRVNYGEVVLELKTSCIPSRLTVVVRIFLSVGGRSALRRTIFFM
ncbi:hypothetical protein Tco_0644735 [Tanacetum coccineum]